MCVCMHRAGTSPKVRLETNMEQEEVMETNHLFSSSVDYRPIEQTFFVAPKVARKVSSTSTQYMKF